MIKATGGTWDPNAWPTYFVASSPEICLRASDVLDDILIAVNEVHAPAEFDRLSALLDQGKRVFIDSGVFWLSTQHAKRNGLSMNEALALDPEEIDDFDWLFDAYVDLIRKVGDRSWGYIEIDQGGRENKIRTRARLEALGLRPIPVYHPFNDGWDYFDNLAENYDRICFGNVVQADTETRKRLMATAWERRSRYPHLWIHLLGLTPSEKSAAYPIPSCDSSTWLSTVRWGAHNAMVANKRCWSTGSTFLYRIGDDAEAETGHLKARRLAGYEAEMMKRTMLVMADEATQVLGVDIAGAVR